MKRTRKGKPAPEEEGDEGNPETRPGTPVSSLIHVQKENSPKILPTRPAGLRRGAEKTRGSPKRSRKGERKGKGSVKRTRKGKPAPEEEGDEGNSERSLIHVQKENDETGGSPKRSRKDPRLSEEEPKRRKERKRKREEDSKRKTGPRRGRRRRNRETRPGTPVSSLIHVQKENSPKTVPARPAAFRRRAEKEKRKEKNARRGLEKRSGTGKGRRRRKPGNAAGNAGVKFDAGSKGKLTKNRSDETRGSPKRSRKGKNKEKKARTSFTQKSASRPVQKQYYRSKGSRVFTQKSASRPVQKQYYRSKGSRVVGVECSH